MQAEPCKVLSGALIAHTASACAGLQCLIVSVRQEEAMGAQKTGVV